MTFKITKLARRLISLSLLVLLLGACSSLFKDTKNQATFVVNTAKIKVAKNVYRQAKKCWATEYKTPKSFGDVALDVFDSVVLGEDDVRTKTTVKSISELDGIHIISYYQHDGLSHLSAEQKADYEYYGIEHPIIKILITEISQTSSRLTIVQYIGQEEGHDAVKEVKRWIKGNNKCHKPS